MADERGQARFTLPAGSYRIEVRAPGFEALTVQVEVEAGRETSVVVELHSEVIEVEELIATSTRIGRRVQDEPLRVEILGEEEIAEKMLMTPGNIAMLLNETGGLRVQVTSPSLGAANIRVQGMRGRYTQLLADGLPLYGGQAGSIGLLQIPPMDLGQVEVIKGAASALYGASALGGVINLISRQPSSETSGELLLNVGSQNGQDLIGYVSGPMSETTSGTWGYSLLGGLHRQEPVDLDGSGWIDVAEHERWVARPRVSWGGEGGRSLFMTAGAMAEDRRGGTRPGQSVPNGAPFPQTLATDRVDFGVRVQWPLGGLAFLQLRASAMSQDHRHRFGGATEVDEHSTAFGEAVATGAAGRHTWLLGMALQQDAYRSETYSGFDYTHTVPGLFAQNEFRISPALIASASARWDAHSEYGSHLSPRVSILFRPDPWVIRGSMGAGFFAPTPFVEEIEEAGLAFLLPFDGVRAEKARTFSIDAGRTLGPIEGNVVFFGSRVEDAVRLVREGSGGAGGVRVTNVEGETLTAGVELLGRYRRDHLTFTGSYVFVRATEPEAGTSNRRAVPLTPRHTAGLVGMWEDHDRGLLGVEAYFTGRQPLDENPYRTQSRPQLHLGVLGELRRGRWSVFMNAENLLNVRQTRHDPLVLPSRAPDGRWTVDVWSPIEGFTVNGGVRLRVGG